VAELHVASVVRMADTLVRGRWATRSRVKRGTMSLMSLSFSLDNLWATYRGGERVRCPAENDGRLALLVQEQDRLYLFRCVTCGWTSPWFLVVDDVPLINMDRDTPQSTR
jgi:hypothetical protein